MTGFTFKLLYVLCRALKINGMHYLSISLSFYSVYHSEYVSVEEIVNFLSLEVNFLFLMLSRKIKEKGKV